MAWLKQDLVLTIYKIRPDQLTREFEKGRLQRQGKRRKYEYDSDDLETIFSNHRRNSATAYRQPTQPPNLEHGNVTIDEVAVKNFHAHTQEPAAPRANRNDAPDKRVIVVGNDKALTFNEASRALKQEDVIKRQLDNMEREGALVDREKFESAVRDSLHELFPGLVSTLQGLVDTWGISLCLSPVDQESMKQDFRSAILRTWDGVKKKIEKAAKV